MTDQTTQTTPEGRSFERPVRPWEKCAEHGPAQPNVWACPACLVDLRRWKSTHAPRLDALEALLTVAQREAAQGKEARETLESERAANALLTEQVQQLELAEEGAKEAFGVVVQRTRDLEKEVRRLTELLTGAHRTIREYANGQRLPNTEAMRHAAKEER
jgi:hypothetical protein